MSGHDGAAREISSRLPQRIRRRLRLPLIAAPMFRVSGIELVVAACKAGIVGAFPTLNAHGEGQLDAWLTEMRSRLADAHDTAAPICPNLIMARQETAKDLEICIRHGVEMVITSVGSPKPYMPQLRDAGILVFADVATLEHAKKARDLGVDGLVLLSAGAGGQTGWMNGFAFARAAREIFDGPLIMSGGISDGVALRAAEVLGCDLGYMGTRFIATAESLAAPAYREMLVSSSMDDIVLTSAFTGLPGNFLKPSILANGISEDEMDEEISAQRAEAKYGKRASGPRRWSGIWAAGHTVSAVDSIQTVDQLVEQVACEYAAAS